MYHDCGGKGELLNTALFDFLAANHGGDGLAVFQVYSDESGKLADSQCVAFGSLVFDQDESLPFSKRWNEYLETAGVRYLSMKEAMHFNGEFKGWEGRTTDRNDLMEALASLAYDRCAILVRSPMMVSEFMALPIQQRQRLKDLPFAAFEALINGIAHVTSELGIRHRFHLIYDLSEEYSVNCVRMFNRLRSMQGCYRDFFASLSFADDTEFPPLQAADMLAYCVRRSHTETLHTEAPVIKRIAEILFKNKPLRKRDLVYEPQSGLGCGIIRLPIQ